RRATGRPQPVATASGGPCPLRADRETAVTFSFANRPSLRSWFFVARAAGHARGPRAAQGSASSGGPQRAPRPNGGGVGALCGEAFGLCGEAFSSGAERTAGRAPRTASLRGPTGGQRGAQHRAPRREEEVLVR